MDRTEGSKSINQSIHIWLLILIDSTNQSINQLINPVIFSVEQICKLCWIIFKKDSSKEKEKLFYRILFCFDRLKSCGLYSALSLWFFFHLSFPSSPRTRGPLPFGLQFFLRMSRISPGLRFTKLLLVRVSRDQSRRLTEPSMRGSAMDLSPSSSNVLHVVAADADRHRSPRHLRSPSLDTAGDAVWTSCPFPPVSLFLLHVLPQRHVSLSFFTSSVFFFSGNFFLNAKVVARKIFWKFFF